ncbi:MAG: hypothetical protein HXX10_19105 [Rhodoplanes sp.]|uniref:hypothetical protein n=1 Tax=Rhodoplanes sp. TaxID=1968906 RepID=UPI0017E1528F|nr:hypothetical protein [Rhodoplanes sp.]NVO16147.1 hypothetical protein [Rhodoplanes sp.]
MAKLTMLQALCKARDLVQDGVHDGIFEALHALKAEAGGPTRDCACFALMQTAGDAGAGTSIGSHGGPNAAALALLDATIERLTGAMH